MKKLTIRLDDEVHKRLRLRSVEAGVPIQKMVERWIEEELKRKSVRPKTKRFPPSAPSTPRLREISFDEDD